MNRSTALSWPKRRRSCRRFAAVTVTAAVLTTLVAGPALATTDTLRANHVSHYGTVLATGSKFSLYLLTNEKGGKLHCTGGCLSVWFPLEVSKATKHISVGSGVHGKIGFVSRGAEKQVTFNSYPVYTYAGDNDPGQANGESIPFSGGTWYLVRASAKTPVGSPVK